jgi:hypothetical protein
MRECNRMIQGSEVTRESHGRIMFPPFGEMLFAVIRQVRVVRRGARNDRR